MRTLSLIATVLFASATAAEAPQAQLDATLKTLAKTKETEAALAKKHEKLQSELTAMQNRAALLAERLQVSERRVSEEERALAGVSGKLTAKQRQYEDRKADYAATLSTLLRMRNMPVTVLYGEKDDLNALMRTASVLEETNRAVRSKAEGLKRDLRELGQLKDETATRQKRTSAETMALTHEQEELAKALRARQTLEAQLAHDRARAEAQVAELSRESESLQSLISKLEVEEKRKAAEEAAKPKPSKKPAKQMAATKGNLRAPVSGDVIHRYGERKSANDTYRGMVIRARGGATVVAPSDGEIAFIGPFRDYGNMVLIKHPNGYISLIAGLGKLTARLNQSVIRGEPIALMADGKSPEAYVELRDSAAKPIDPGEWFANLTKGT